MDTRPKPKLNVPLTLTITLVATLTGCPDPHEGLDCTVPDSGACNYDYAAGGFRFPDGGTCERPPYDTRCYS